MSKRTKWQPTIEITHRVWVSTGEAFEVYMIGGHDNMVSMKATAPRVPMQYPTAEAAEADLRETVAKWHQHGQADRIVRAEIVRTSALS